MPHDPKVADEFRGLAQLIAQAETERELADWWRSQKATINRIKAADFVLCQRLDNARTTKIMKLRKAAGDR